MARLMSALDTVMPAEMSLLNLELSVDEKNVTAVRTALGPAPKADVKTDRQLLARLQGVAPTDVDLANFVTRLSAVPYFQQINITYSRQTVQSGHLLCEFEVTFAIDLNDPALAGSNVVASSGSQP